MEAGKITEDPTLEPDLLAAFPPIAAGARARGDRLQHRLRREIIATKIANRFVNRLGITAIFSLTEEEGASFGQAAAAFVAAERLFGMDEFWHRLDTSDLPEQLRLELYERASRALQLHIADILRNSSASAKLAETVETLAPGLGRLNGAVESLLRREVSAEAAARRKRLTDQGAPEELVEPLVRLFELNGGVGIAALGRRLDTDVIGLTNAYTRLGEVLGLDWAQGAATRFQARDQWERLLTAGLAREFEQLRLDFLYRKRSAEPGEAVEQWVKTQGPRIEQFRGVVDRARHSPVTTAAMLAQIATQARVLLGR